MRCLRVSSFNFYAAGGRGALGFAKFFWSRSNTRFHVRHDQLVLECLLRVCWFDRWVVLAFALCRKRSSDGRGRRWTLRRCRRLLRSRPICRTLRYVGPVRSLYSEVFGLLPVRLLFACLLLSGCWWSVCLSTDLLLQSLTLIGCCAFLCAALAFFLGDLAGCVIGMRLIYALMLLQGTR